MPKFNPENRNIKIKTSTLGEVELKYISSGDAHKYMELLGSFEEVDGRLELQRNEEISDKDFTIKILYNQLLKPKMEFDEFRKVKKEEIKEIGEAFIEKESLFFKFYKNKGSFFKDFRVAVEKKLEKDIEPIKKRMTDAVKRVKVATENIQNILPKVRMPKIFNIEDRKIINFKSPEIVREENNWERHAQLLETQRGILNGQKKGAKLTWTVIVISFLTLIVSCVGVVYSIFEFEWLSGIIGKLF